MVGKPIQSPTDSVLERDRALRVLHPDGVALGSPAQRNRAEQASLARTDTLTGLPNRRSFEELARRELARADRLRSPLALVVIDLDDFKLINDQHGHAAGDRALCRFAATAMRIFRSVDVAARMGGDEFALLLPDVEAQSALLALHRFQSALLDDQRGPISCSIGVAHVVGGDLDDALRHADNALYRAKASGKGAIELVEVPVEDQTPGNASRSSGRPAIRT